MGNFHITPSHPDHATVSGPRPGARYVASVDRLGQRVTTACVTLERECAPEEFPLKDLLRAYGIRYIPNLDIAANGRPLNPTEILGAYHFRFSYRTAGVHVLHDFLAG